MQLGFVDELTRISGWDETCKPLIPLSKITVASQSTARCLEPIRAICLLCCSPSARDRNQSWPFVDALAVAVLNVLAEQAPQVGPNEDGHMIEPRRWVLSLSLLLS